MADNTEQTDNSSESSQRGSFLVLWEGSVLQEDLRCERTLCTLHLRALSPTEVVPRRLRGAVAGRPCSTLRRQLATLTTVKMMAPLSVRRHRRIVEPRQSAVMPSSCTVWVMHHSVFLYRARAPMDCMRVFATLRRAERECRQQDQGMRSIPS